MTGRHRTVALVLKARAYGDDDLIVDLLCDRLGRLSVLARAARRSQRRYGGALEMGVRLDAEIRFRAGRDLHSLGHCEVIAPLRKIREDLDRIQGLAYLLELVRLATRDGAHDTTLFAMACAFIDALEEAAATTESIALWEIALLAHLGYGAPGGPDLPDTAHDTLRRLAAGDATARFLDADVEPVRRHFESHWTRVLGHAPRSARFLAA
ncbi:MAG: DNA repair protein RecO [Bradymonadia bacterium]